MVDGGREPVGWHTRRTITQNKADAASVAREHRRDQQQSATEYHQQQDELVNAKGRSWTYHECTLLTLILGMHDTDTREVGRTTLIAALAVRVVGGTDHCRQSSHQT